MRVVWMTRCKPEKAQEHCKYRYSCVCSTNFLKVFASLFQAMVKPLGVAWFGIHIHYTIFIKLTSKVFASLFQAMVKPLGVAWFGIHIHYTIFIKLTSPVQRSFAAAVSDKDTWGKARFLRGLVQTQQPPVVGAVGCAVRLGAGAEVCLDLHEAFREVVQILLEILALALVAGAGEFTDSFFTLSVKAVAVVFHGNSFCFAQGRLPCVQG